ncbi:hypothetical protein O6H91_01G168500 [Diphasiastrum complanatum]|uniref:Uncharacterized protein n=1 Tax=Diphasiastrum complanatum TaxID=34168 RepID=A0ACC2EYK1_DIPCM|nr:hypothetical protein O6H91_01G168500 [Diphasiastrum complanatum]
MDDELQSLVNYYARVGYGHHILTVCSQQLKKRPHDPCLLFWHAFGAILEGLYPEGLQALGSIQENNEFQFGVIAVKIHAWQFYGVLAEEDQDLFQHLSSAEKNASEKSLLHAAIVYWNLPGTQNLQRAKDLIARIMIIQPQCLQAKCIRGWIVLREIESENLNVSDFGSAEDALEYFSDVIRKGTSIEASLGRSYYYEIKRDYTRALSELNQVIVNHPRFLPALCEKGRLCLLMQEWDLVRDTSQQILAKDSENIDGLRLRIHWMLCHENQVASAARHVVDLLKSIDHNEPHNANLYYEASRTIAAIAGRRASEVLHKTITLVQRAQAIIPEKASYVVELANQLFLLEDYTSAISQYRLASQMDKVNMDSMHGLTQCLLFMGTVKEAEEQLEFLFQISVSFRRSARLTYLFAQWEWRKSKSHERCYALLAETMDLHKKTIRSKYDYAYYAELNPDMLFGVAQLYFTLFRLETKGPYKEQSLPLVNSASILEMVLSAIPGLLSGQLMLAYVYFCLADVESAFNTIQVILRLDSSCARAQFLLAQIYVQQGDHGMGKQSLEQALSNDFLIQDTLQYHILHAKILLENEENEEALKVLESATSLALPSQLKGENQATINTSRFEVFADTTNTERALLYVLLAKVHVKMDHLLEATSTIDKAKLQFEGTSEEAQIIIASSELAIARGNVEAALDILNQVPYESNYYISAKVALADIYLNVKHSKELFASCYAELADHFPHVKVWKSAHCRF